MGDYQMDSSSATFDLITSSSSMEAFQFVSRRCKPTLVSLPPELLSRIAFNLSLCEFSYLSRVSSAFHKHLFHPAEIVLFLKTRYRLSIESGSIIIFSYLANMQVRAPLLLERIFDDFFLDSPLRLEEERLWKEQRQSQKQLLNNNTFLLTNAASASGGLISASNVAVQRMDSVQVHEDAEKARRKSKWDAVRMLGVLYALDKTHVGPSSSMNALVLSGASDITELPPPSPPAPLKVQEPASKSSINTPSTPGSNLSADRESLERTSHNPFIGDKYQPSSSRPSSGGVRNSPKSASFSSTLNNSPPHGQYYQDHGARSNSLRRSHSQERMDLGDVVPKSSLLDAEPLRYYIQKRNQRKRRSPSIGSSPKGSSSSVFPYPPNGHHAPWEDPFEEGLEGLSWTPSSYPFSFGATSSSSLTDYEGATSKGKSRPKSRTPSPQARERAEGFLREKQRRLSLQSSPQDRFVNDNGLMRRISHENGDLHGYSESYDDDEHMSQQDFNNYEEEEFIEIDNTAYPQQHQPSQFLSSSTSRLGNMDHKLDGYSSKGVAAFEDRHASDKIMEDKMPGMATNSNPYNTRRRSRTAAFDSPTLDERYSPPSRFSARLAPVAAAAPIPMSAFGALGNNTSSPPFSSSSSSSSAVSPVEAPTVHHPVSRSSFTEVRSTYSRSAAQQVLNRVEKIAFLTKYTDRMHLKLQALGIKDWGQGDIQRKKTYQLMIQHNDKTGEKDLVQFYLGRYGGSIPQPEDGNPVVTTVVENGQHGAPVQPMDALMPAAEAGA
ncbi:hypothetical protein EMPS_11053 [Entomortierella parvispora]|uniref:F-box domain-containing protein n=1 Tax=Entomortierella parvispora TaxID=205924 RepID=A0A9P3HKX8_9FUNG|nr:hypothetical protein EMPS_11053 [Entomortierella parvispora]